MTTSSIDMNRQSRDLEPIAPLLPETTLPETTRPEALDRRDAEARVAFSGAVMYVPANHPNLARILQGEKLAAVKALIICLEDAIAPHEYPQALANLKSALATFSPDTGKRCFVRPRHIASLQEVMRCANARDCFIGAVLPKFNAAAVATWATAISRLNVATTFALMPTLETVDVFDARAMHELADRLSDSVLTVHVNSLRIGGNDLLSLLNMRRPRGKTLYETALSATIAQLATTFIPKGFDLSAPVFEYLNDDKTLAREVAMDIDYGLTGKTAIHPQQIPTIEAAYRASRAEISEAQAILQPDAAGVFRMNDAMCEPETHRNWAEKIQRRAERFGVLE